MNESLEMQNQGSPPRETTGPAASSDSADQADPMEAEMPENPAPPEAAEAVASGAAGDESAAPDAAPSRAYQLRLVEALLFASAGPLDRAAIAARLPEGTEIESLIAELATHYEGRGVNLVRIAGGWTLRTAPDLGAKLRLEQTVVRKLSRAAMETLAIIAYHQPVTRAEIEEIRGVVISKGTLDTLMETGWIAPKGRRETPGRPVTWVTTEDFLLHFSLSDRSDLPGIDELKAAGLIGPRPDVTLSEHGHMAPPVEETPAEEDEGERLFEPDAAADDPAANEKEPRPETQTSAPAPEADGPAKDSVDEESAAGG